MHACMAQSISEDHIRPLLCKRNSSFGLPCQSNGLPLQAAQSVERERGLFASSKEILSKQGALLGFAVSAPGVLCESRSASEA